ncbi:copper resistance protein NlpE [Pedobacter sp. BS3]|uniref:copper resistance protein NlpE n=1 Tax=Pedobacter sp. BS3 TaxID=2567937 RepID=UPI0011EE062A|nr:copper resistance protein NlpE [Pedobacter sp. BS3]TZF81456.1 copper resistance protein NlpE [Pedobacter sp. BS3]
MKHCMVLFFLLGVLGCHRNDKVKLQGDTDPSLADSLSEKPVTNSFAGVLPCADCAGIDTRLVLFADSTYSLSEKYLKKDNGTPFMTRGSYTVRNGFQKDKRALVVILDESNPQNKRYYVQYSAKPKYLYMLDKDGRPITSKLSYMLKKVK